MGKKCNSVVVLQIELNFWWMMPVGVKDNHTKFKQDGGGHEWVRAVADPSFKICPKWTKKMPLYWGSLGA